MNNPKSHVLVCWPGEGLADTGFQNLAAVDHRFDIRHGAEGWVLPQRGPVAVVSDKPGIVLGDVLIQPPLHRKRQGLENFPFFNRRDAFEGINIVGMNGKQTDKLIHPFVHIPIELGKRREVLSDLGLLFNSLFEETFRHNKLYILPCY